MSAARAICKQLFGAKYERIVRSLLVSVILFFSLFGAGVRITIAPFILYLTATAFSAGIMWQTIGSNRHAETFMGLFMLPFPRNGLTLSYVLSFAAYTLITKSFFVLALLFAVGGWNVAQMVTALLCAVNGCLLAAAWYSMPICKKWPLVAIWTSGIAAAIFLAPGALVMAVACAVSIVIAFILLTRTDAYVFYRSGHTRQVVKHKSGTASVFVYLLRYADGLCRIELEYADLYAHIRRSRYGAGSAGNARAGHALLYPILSFHLLRKLHDKRHLPNMLAVQKRWRRLYRASDRCAVCLAEFHFICGVGVASSASQMEGRNRSVASSEEIPRAGGDDADCRSN